MRVFKQKVIPLFIASSITALSPNVHAQAQNDLVLQEIIVTASKRETTLQSTPVSVSVVTADTIEVAHIQDLIDLQSVVPSLRVSQQQSTTSTNFVIRGFGNGFAANRGIEPSVGVFVDGVYRSRAGAAIDDLPRVERVEVISGPQSTLFGKNASAGVISISTPRPSGDSGGYVSGSIGNLSSVLVRGLYEGSINDDLTFDVSGSYNSRDGFFRNEQLDEDLNERDRFSLRGQIVYQPSEKTSWRFLADYSDLDEACCNIVNVVSGPATQALTQLGAQVVANDPSAERGFFDTPSTNELTNSGFSLQLDHEFSNLKFTSITALRNSESADQIDADFTNLPVLSGSRTRSNIDTLTQEFRLNTVDANRFNWLAGAYFFDESIDVDTDVTFGPGFRPFVQAQLPLPLTSVEGLLGAPIGSFYQSGSGAFENFSLENQSFSVFGQLDVALSDSLTATIGLNYTKDEKEFALQQRITELRNTLFLPAPFDVLPVVLPNLVNLPNSVESNETDDDELTYTARLQWAPTENINLYATYATGFKASSVNLDRGSAPLAADFTTLRTAGLAGANSISGTRFASPEESTLYEVGIKTTFERGAFNLAIFDQRIDGFQTFFFVGTDTALTNAERQSVTGAEFDLTYLPSNSVTLSLKGTVLDPVYDSFENAPGGSLTGEEVAAIANTSISLGGQYDFRIGGYDAFLRGDYQFVEDSPLLQGFSTDIASSEVKLLNLSAGLITGNGLTFTVWGRNVTDHDFLFSIFPTVAQPGSFSGFRNEPRTFGLNVRKDF